jgi:hypothetical protein
VIGVTAGGKPRAYLLRAFDEAPGGGLIVHDKLGERSVVVTRRDGYHSVEVAVGKGGPPIPPHVPPDAATPRADDPASVEGVSWQLADWESWRRDHPDTDVYIGPGRQDAEQ